MELDEIYFRDVPAKIDKAIREKYDIMDLKTINEYQQKIWKYEFNNVQQITLSLNTYYEQTVREKSYTIEKSLLSDNKYTVHENPAKTRTKTETHKKAFPEYAFFKKGTVLEAMKLMKQFAPDSEKYFVQKSISSSGKTPSQGAFNLYRLNFIFSILLLLAFDVLMVMTAFWDFHLSIRYFHLWTCFGFSALFALTGSILYSIKISDFRPNKYGVYFTLHAWIIPLLQLVTIGLRAFAGALDNTENILISLFVTILGWLVVIFYYATALACFVYPIVLIVKLHGSWDEFSVYRIRHNASVLSAEKFSEMKKLEEDIRNCIPHATCDELKKLISGMLPSDMSVSISS